MTRLRSLSCLHLIVLLLCCTACGDEESNTHMDMCNEGDRFTQDDQSFCIYGQSIVEEGFECPDDLPFRHDLEGFSACSESSSLPEGFEASVHELDGYSPENPDDPNNDGTTPSETILEGECPDLEGVEDGEGLTYQVLFAAQAVKDDFPTSNEMYQIIEDQGSWDNYVSKLTYTTDEETMEQLSAYMPDFSNVTVVAVWLEENSTCGLDVENWLAYSPSAGEVHVDATFRDGSRGCPGVCGAVGGAHVVVEFERPTKLTVCRRITGGCP